jgi:hypothetical protein
VGLKRRARLKSCSLQKLRFGGGGVFYYYWGYKLPVVDSGRGFAEDFTSSLGIEIEKIVWKF